MDTHAFSYWIRMASSLFILVPIFVGFIRYKIAGTVYRLFLFFMVYGFLCDLFEWLFMDVAQVSIQIFRSYTLVESVFIFYFVMVVNKSTAIKKICRILIAVAIPFWIVSYLFFAEAQRHMSVYMTTYYVVSSFLLGFSLLRLSEKSTSLYKDPLFWFLLSMFINFFCTFFITALLETELRHKIWFIYNIVSLTSSLILIKAFFSIRSDQRLPDPV